MTSYPVFMAAAGRVEFHAYVGVYRGTDYGIHAILVGEEGRGRKLGVLPVAGEFETRAPTPGNPAVGLVRAAQIGETRSGSAKLIAVPAPDTDEAAIVVFQTAIGFRGDNAHQGMNGADLPGRILVDGRIAQGQAGAMGSGRQIVLLLPKDEVVHVHIGGRMYGEPRDWYYVFNGTAIIARTTEQLRVVDDPLFEEVNLS